MKRAVRVHVGVLPARRSKLSEALLGAACLLLVGVPMAACSDSAGDKASSSGGADAGTDGEVSFDTGEELRVAVPASGRVYVKLKSPPAVVTPADPKSNNLRIFVLPTAVRQIRYI